MSSTSYCTSLATRCRRIARPPTARNTRTPTPGSTYLNEHVPSAQQTAAAGHFSDSACHGLLLPALTPTFVSAIIAFRPAMPTARAPLSTAPQRPHSIRNTILKAFFAVGSLSTVAKLATAGTAILIAFTFGTSDELESYFVAYLIPSLLINVIAESIRPALIPVYLEVRERDGADEARFLVSNVTTIAIPCLLAAVAAFAASSSYLLPLLASGFSPEKLYLTKRLFYVLLPLIPINGIATIWASVLNANKRFSAVALAPIMVPAATTGAILLWQRELGVFALGVGAIVGTLGQLVLLRCAIGRQPLIGVPRWRNSSPAVRRVVSQYLPMVGGAFLLSGAWLIDQAMAASLTAGSVASLNYANRFVSLILHVAAGTVGTVMFPFFASLAANRKWTELRRILMTCAGWTLFATVTLSVSLLFVSETLVGLTLERGRFASTDTEQVGRIQSIYGLQIPFQVCGILFVRVISSMRANHVLMIGAVFSLIINVVLNYLFMRIWGVVGIAASTVVVYAVSAIFLTAVAWRMLARRISDCDG